MLGKQFNNWTVLSFSGKTKVGNWLWLCECKCGNQGIVSGSNLRLGKSTQCKKCSSTVNGRKGLDAMAKEHLYMIGNDNYLKIGSTDNVQRRFKDLQNSCPYKLEIFYEGLNEGYMEPLYHSIFKEQRMHGEWFNL